MSFSAGSCKPPVAPSMAAMAVSALVALWGAGPARAQDAQHRTEAPPRWAAASAKPAKPSGCKAERRKTARVAQHLQRQEGALRRLRSKSRSTTLAKRRVKESQRHLRKQEAQSNRACGIRIEMKLAQRAVEAQPSAIAEISGDPRTGQAVTLEPGTRVPPRGGYLVVDATSSGPGVLGKVTATSKLRGGRTKLSLRPATLDQVYERFDLRFDGSLAALSDSSSLRTQEAATASAQSSASKLTLFRCQGPRIKKPDIVVDLTPLKVSSEIDVQRRYVHFLVSGRPLLRLRFEMTAGAKCQLDENVRVFIPVAGPVGIELAPVVELSASADSKLDFELAPHIAVGFERGGPSGDQDFRVFNTARGPSVTLHGSLGVDAFAGGAIGVSVGGRAGLRGKFGPAFIARGNAGAGQICAEVNSALRIGLDAYANVFIANLTIQLGKGEFLRRSLYSGCVGANDADGSGGHGGEASDGSPGGNGGNPVPGGGPLTGAVDIAAGAEHTCAVLANGHVKCWGYNAHGQLGNGNHNGPEVCDHPVFEGSTVGCSLTAVAVNGITNAVAVAAGHVHSCALLASGEVRCWGEDGNGQLGNGDPPGEVTYTSSPVPVSGISNAIAIGAGYYSTCAVLETGAAKCWGANEYGQGGNGSWSFEPNSTSPVAVSGLVNAVDIDGAWAHWCATLTTGELRCWGNNEPDGLLGSGATEGPEACYVGRGCSVVPLAVSGVTGAKEVSAFWSHVCAVLESGGAVCWGSNFSAQLGTDDVASSAVPLPVEGVNGVSNLAVGFGHTCAVLAGGEIECWGANGHGQLGSLTPGTWSASPLTVEDIADAQAASVGERHSCAVLDGGRVRCWGSNNLGQLGDGSTTNSLDPVVVLSAQ